ncbi:MAG: hypothetical protein COT16_03185, partial [Elusimicrobia bacterium CG08_land_8_20_14_0_20_44_26]
CDYGDIIEVHAALMIPMEQKNPGAFDYKEYLKSMFGVYACMYPRQSEQVKKIGENPGWLLKFALVLKKKMICIIKQTIPHPQSAFLGGVTLGTRGGVPPQMKFEFQATGVAHVLSVSGLHAGFIAALFFMLCLLAKIPPRPRWFVVTCGLLIFTLITGARPATVRSALMYSVMLLFNTFRLSLKTSTSLTIPVTAVFILSGIIPDITSPLLLPSASFTLSYMAVWSLCYLTGPVQAFFETYIKSWTFIVFFFWVFFFTTVASVNFDLFYNKFFLEAVALTLILTFIAAGALNKTKPLLGLAVHKMPPSLYYLVQFFYAQFAIQLGMMIPLSALYFHRFPTAGIYANFIAIPLIGFIVMVGFLSGLIGAFFSALSLAPVGALIALYLNAGNYWLCNIFMGVAHFFFKAFRYPFMPTFKTSWMFSYYAVILLIVCYKPVLEFFADVRHRLRYLSREELFMRFSAFAAAILLFFLLYNYKFKKEKTENFRAIILNIGFGNSNLLTTPDGKHVLVDTTQADEGDFNISNLAAAFTFYQIGGFSDLILTNLKPENTGNAAAILPYFPTGKVFTAYKPEDILKKMAFQKFLDFLGDETLKEKWDTSYVQNLYDNVYYMRKVPLIANKDFSEPRGAGKIFYSRKGVPLYAAKRGDIIYSSLSGGSEFMIKVLWPAEEKLAGTPDDLANNSIVLKATYGKFSMLMPSDIMNEAQGEMLKYYKPEELKSDILIAPFHGNMSACLAEWYEAVSPKVVIIPYSYLKGWSFAESDINPTLEKCRELGAKVMRLDKYGAVCVTSDGKNVTLESVKKPIEAGAGEASQEDSSDVF